MRPSGSSNGQPLIKADGIWKIFGRNADKVIGTPDADLPRAELREKTGCVAAVRDVSFDVYPGEVFVVMGLSGSGKSTLVRTLIRLIEPTAGRIEIDGRDVTAASHDELLQLRRHTSSMVFQHFGLLAHRTVIDNVAFGLEVQGVSKAQRHARAAEVWRRSCRSPSCVAAHTSLPSISIWPAVGSISRMSVRTSVDLPEPERPMTTKISPGQTSKETSRTAATQPCFARSSERGRSASGVPITLSAWRPKIFQTPWARISGAPDRSLIALP